MFCPNCNKDLMELSFLDSLSHVNTCLESKRHKAKTKRNVRKVAKSGMCALMCNSTAQETTIDSSHVRLIVTIDGRIVQQRERLSEGEIKKRISCIFDGTIVCNQVNQNKVSSLNAFKLANLLSNSSDSFTAKGFERYINSSKSPGRRFIRNATHESPNCGYIRTSCT